MTVTLPAMAGREVFDLDAAGKRSGTAVAKAGAAGTVTVQLKGGSRVEFAKQ